MKTKDLIPEMFAEIMNKYNECLEKWISMYGNEEGFNTWFTKQIMKKNQMKIRNLITKKIVIVWPSTNHPDSSYGMAQWVDKNGNSYGQCDIWPVPFGFEKIE